MTFHWPQITYVVLLFVSLLLSSLVNGLPRTGKHSFAQTLVVYLFHSWLLYMGGFFAGVSP